MSKTETAVTVPIKKTYKYFDADFNEQSKEITVNFEPALKYEDAVSRIGNDTVKITKAINNLLKREALSEAKKSVKAEGISSKAVMTFLRPFREVAPYKDMERAEQTKALIGKVKESSFMLEAIKAASLAEVETDDDEDSDN